MRIEHDEEGAVLFRERRETAVTNEQATRSRPMLRLAVGASLLVAACGKTEPPTPAPEPPRTEVVSPEKPTSPEELMVALTRPEGKTAVGTNGQRSTDTPVDEQANPKGQKGHAKKTGAEPKKGVIQGCACQVNDPLCSCL